MSVSATQTDVLTLTLNDPGRRNPLAPNDVATIASHVERGTSPVVITGAGGHFCAGLDLDVLAAMSPSGVGAFVEEFERLCVSIATSPRPIVAAVEGRAAGGGTLLVLSCDLVVMARGASLSLGSPAIGATVPRALVGITTSALGLQLARRMLFQGAALSAEEAASAGLCPQPAQRGGALKSALTAARRCPTGPALATTKLFLAGAETGERTAETFARLAGAGNWLRGAKPGASPDEAPRKNP